MKFKKIKIKLFFILIICLSFFSKQINAIENKILLKIDNKIITSIDIQNEINYLNSINQSFAKLKNEKKIDIAKNSLIRVKIKELTLEKIIEKIKLNESDFEKILISNFSTVDINEIDQLSNYLAQYNLTTEMLRKRIEIETFWNQFIYSRYNKNIKIDLENIKKNILKNNKQKEYLLSEIVFKLDVKENFQEKFETIKQSIIAEGFENSALIHSISDSANVGGKLGWISESSINEDILNEIFNTKINNYTKPIKIPSGFLILQIKEIRETNKDINLEEEIKRVIKIKTNEQLNQYSNLFYNKAKKDIIINEL